MKNLSRYRPLLGAALACLCCMPAFADAPAAEPLGGPALPGLCLLSQQAVFANAKVGVAASARLKQIVEQAQGEVDAERKTIEADSRTLDGQRATLDPGEFQKKQQALTVRMEALQQKAARRDREVQATREKALARIATEAQPVIAQVYKARGCGVIIDRSTVLGGNMEGDLTAAVVQGLDARITTISFERETLPVQATSASH